MISYSKYTIKNDKRETTFQFVENDKLPSGIPISTPFTFPFIGTKVVLCLDKNRWWNPLGGHIEAGETYQDTLVREAYEEGGVRISTSSIRVVGYIRNDNIRDSSDLKYPPVSILPITTSFVTKVDPDWQPLETSARGLFSPKNALLLMSSRDDNHQMWEILKYVVKSFENQKYRAKFTYHPNKILKNIPVTQVFTFCKDKLGKFCIVRDRGEGYFSLPGGGCELGESPEDCLRRELLEEAQITCKNVKFLGSILIELSKDGRLVSKFQHLRYLADVDILKPFIPQKNGFETNVREFVPFSELESKVFILQNSTAKKVIDHVLSIQE